MSHLCFDPFWLSLYKLYFLSLRGIPFISSNIYLFVFQITLDPFYVSSREK